MRVKTGLHQITFADYGAAQEHAMRCKNAGGYSITVERIRDTITGRYSEHGPRFRVSWKGCDV